MAVSSINRWLGAAVGYVPLTRAHRMRTRLMHDGRAVTAVEYGIVAAFLCLVLLGIFSSFGSVLTTMFNRASSGI